MKKQLLKALGVVSLAFLLLAVSAQARVSTQAQNDNEKGLIGSWNLTVTLRDCETGTPFVSFSAMNTYNKGGTMQQTAVPGPESYGLPGHGVWSHLTGRNYSVAFQFFSFNPDGSYAGKVIVRSTINLGQSGDDYTSTDAAEIFNPNGDLMFRACSTTTATRFK
jgi:hypothetical protein